MTKGKILLVDDEKDLLETMALRLTVAGYEVVTAVDGQAALDRVKQEKPDLIILDLMLPRIDGYKVCRLLKFDGRYKQIPILICTARAQSEDVQMAKDCGANAYLTKPFDAPVLLAKVQSLVDEARRPPSGGGEGR